jgi:hypothetical protein
MIHAYRLVYSISDHAPPQLWEFEQPYIDNLLLNARTFDRWVVQWHFENWAALDLDNTRIWDELVASFVHRSNLLKSWDKTDIRQGRRSGACGQKNTASTRLLAHVLPRSRTHCSDRTALV